MPEPDPVHCAYQKEDENELDQNIQPNLQALNSFSSCGGRSFSHWSQPPFARLKSLISQRQQEDCHAQIKNDRPCIDDASRIRAHVFDRGNIAEPIACSASDIQQYELDQA